MQATPTPGAGAARAIVVDLTRRRAKPTGQASRPDARLRDSGAPPAPTTPSLAAPGALAGQPGVMAPMRRRQFLELRVAETGPPPMRVVAFSASRSRALGRLLHWLLLLLRFGGPVAWDWLTRRTSAPRRAAQLRRAFERGGGTCLKLGQHLAMRLDLLPWEYGVELSRMLDRMPPFPVLQAIAAVEATTSRPLGETFARFDPEPVLSTSVACTYQAILRTGEQVVVKVRRPGAGELVMADLLVFDWLAAALEFLTILRPGDTRGMRRELRVALLEELDFVQEARYQDLFRRAARRSGKRFFTAPRIHFDLSGPEVVVQEFVRGMWLWELMDAVEQGDQHVLDLARRLNIDPAKVARRLAWINYWAWHEPLVFRADPHPDKIILGEGGRLTFIDFASVGTVDRTKRRALQENMYYAWKRDTLNMARTSLVLLEPLPSVDVNDLTRELQGNNLQMLLAFDAPGAPHEWFRRTSAQQWVGLLDLARRYHIAIDSHILRFLRGSVMYDSLAVRLDAGVNVVREYRRFARYRARRAWRRLERRLASRAARRTDDRIFLRLEQLAQTGEGLFFRMRHALTIPRVSFTLLVGKGAYAAYSLIRLALQLAGVAMLYGATVAAWRRLVVGVPADLRGAIASAISAVPFWLIATVLVLINVRRLLYRLDDRDD